VDGSCSLPLMNALLLVSERCAETRKGLGEWLEACSLEDHFFTLLATLGRITLRSRVNDNISKENWDNYQSSFRIPLISFDPYQIYQSRMFVLPFPKDDSCQG